MQYDSYFNSDLKITPASPSLCKIILNNIKVNLFKLHGGHREILE